MVESNRSRRAGRHDTGVLPSWRLSFDGQDSRLDGRITVRKLPVVRPGQRERMAGRKE